MTSLAQLLATPSCGVFVFEDDVTAALSPVAGQAPRHVRIAGPTDKQALLQALSTALAFPAYFGFNWDALYDCLTDLPLADTPGLVLEIAALQGFARAHPADLRAAIATFADAAAYWQAHRGRLLVLLGGLGDLGAGLPRLGR